MLGQCCPCVALDRLYLIPSLIYLPGYLQGDENFLLVNVPLNTKEDAFKFKHWCLQSVIGMLLGGVVSVSRTAGPIL